MKKLTRRSDQGPEQKGTRAATMGIFRLVVSKLTRRTSLPLASAPPPETVIEDPVRSVNHIHESIFLASTLTGFML